MTARTPATARSRRTRAELAKAAHDQIASDGTLNGEAIAAAAGVSIATFYAHFETHDDAIAAALDTSLTDVVGVVERVFHIESLIENGLEQVLGLLIPAMHDVFQRESLVLRAAQSRLMAHQSTRQIYRGHEDRSIEHLTRHIDLGQKAALLRAGPPQKRAITMLVLLQGLHNPVLTKKRLDPMVADDLQRVLHALVGPTPAA